MVYSMPDDEIKIKIKKYYDNYFDSKPLIELIGIDTFNRREFAFETFEFNEKQKRFIFSRNQSYENPSILIKNMSTIIPRKLYFGALYDQPLHGSIKNANWVESHLKFDIDITDSKYIRKGICNCEGKKICDKCFEIGKEAVIFLIDTIDEDFSNPKDPILKYLTKDKARIFLSGSRGFHVHYPNVKHLHRITSEKVDQTARRNLIHYIQMTSEKPELHLLHTKIASPSLRKRVERSFVSKFFGEYNQELIQKMKWYNAKGKILKGSKIIEKIPTLAFLTEPFTESIAEKINLSYEKTMENILLYRYPRYDGTPTFDTRKVIKVPMSVDGSTGNIVHEIKDIANFTLKDIISIDHFVT